MTIDTKVSPPQVQHTLVRLLHERLTRTAEAAAEALIGKHEAVDRANALPGVRSVLTQYLREDVIEPNADRETFERFLAAFERYRGIEQLLASERPRLRGGTLPPELTSLREHMAARFQADERFHDLSSSSALPTYVKRMAYLMYQESGLRMSELSANPFLERLLLEHVAAEYQLIQLSPLPPCLHKDAGHKFSVLALDQLYREAYEMPELVGIERGAVRCVLDGRYPSLEGVVARRASLRAEAVRLYSADQVLGPIANTLANYVLTGIYPTVAKAAESHMRAWNSIGDAVQQYPELAAVRRSLALLVSSKTYKTASEAVDRYRSVLDDLTSTLRPATESDAEERGPTAMLAMLVVKKSYPSATAILQHLGSTREAVNREFPDGTELENFRGTAVTRILERRDADAATSASRLRTILGECHRILGEPEDRDGGNRSTNDVFQSTPRTVAWVVFKNLFPSVEIAARALEELTAAAKRAFTQAAAQSSGVAQPFHRTAARMVLCGMYPSVDAAVAAYYDALRGTEQSLPVGADGANRAKYPGAYPLWTKKRS